MERHIQRFLNRVSLIVSIVATLSLLRLFLHHSTCIPLYSFPPSSSGGPHHRRDHHHAVVVGAHPSSTCDPALSSSRHHLTADRRFKKISSSASFTKRADSFSSIFDSLRSLSVLSNSSRVICVSAGAGHEPFALRRSGVDDVTAVDLVEFPPLVERADPHNLPFFDGIFDLGFSSGLDVALFPRRFVEELERTVKKGGAEALVVERLQSDEELEGIKALFRRSSLLETCLIEINLAYFGVHMLISKISEGWTLKILCPITVLLLAGSAQLSA